MTISGKRRMGLPQTRGAYSLLEVLLALGVIAVLLAADGATIAPDFDSAAGLAVVTFDPVTKQSESLVVAAAAAGDSAISLAVTVAKYGADAVVVCAELPDTAPKWVLEENSVRVVVRTDLHTFTDTQREVASLAAAVTLAPMH